MVLDRIQRWQCTRAEPVPLGEVRVTIAALSAEYNRAAVVADPYQAKLAAEELRAQGIEVTEFPFTSASVGRLALSLHQAIRQHRLELPADEDLTDELGSVRLRKNTLGVYRLDHDSGQHDDQAVTLALGVFQLLDANPVPQCVLFGDEDLAAGEVNRFGVEVMRAAGYLAFRADPGDPWAVADRDQDDRPMAGAIQTAPWA